VTRVRVGRERTGTPFPFFFIQRERPSPEFFLSGNGAMVLHYMEPSLRPKWSLHSLSNIMIFLIVLIFSKYQPLLLLLTFLIHSQVPKLLNGAKILTKMLTLWVGRNNVIDDRHRRTAHVITWYYSLSVFVSSTN